MAMLVRYSAVDTWVIYSAANFQSIEEIFYSERISNICSAANFQSIEEIYIQNEYQKSGGIITMNFKINISGGPSDLFEFC